MIKVCPETERIEIMKNARPMCTRTTERCVKEAAPRLRRASAVTDGSCVTRDGKHGGGMAHIAAQHDRAVQPGRTVRSSFIAVRRAH